MLEARKEYKFLYTKNQLYEFLNYFGDEIKDLYPSRTIESIYFDTIDYRFYNLSVLNDIDKVKIRFRKGIDKQIYLEIKSSTNNGKFKIKELTEFSNLDDIKNYQFGEYKLYPVIKIKYFRKYYKLNNIRITLDSNITYQNTPNRLPMVKTIRSNKYIVEYKYLDKNKGELENYFVMNPVSFSKYLEGIQSVYPFMNV